MKVMTDREKMLKANEMFVEFCKEHKIDKKHSAYLLGVFVRFCGLDIEKMSSLK